MEPDSGEQVISTSILGCLDPARRLTTLANNQDIVAAVSPRSIGGVSLFEAAVPITAENVREIHSEAADIAASSRELRNLGFKVLQEGPATTSIGG